MSFFIMPLALLEGRLSNSVNQIPVKTLIHTSHNIPSTLSGFVLVL